MGNCRWGDTISGLPGCLFAGLGLGDCRVKPGSRAGSSLARIFNELQMGLDLAKKFTIPARARTELSKLASLEFFSGPSSN